MSMMLFFLGIQVPALLQLESLESSGLCLLQWNYYQWFVRCFFRGFSNHSCRGYIQLVEVITIFIPFYTPKQCSYTEEAQLYPKKHQDR